MELQINVLTPKNQAQICIEKHKKSLLGIKKAHMVKKQKLISDHEFMWIVPVKNQKDLLSYQKRLTIGEGMIKSFYRQLYKFIHLTNRTIKLGNKLGKAGKKGVAWIARRMNKILTKQIDNPETRKEMLENLKLETVKIEKGLFKEIIIEDREAMDKLLSGELIKTTIIK